jgi:hypothetical protein
VRISFTPARPELLRHISTILCRRSKEQVLWPNTRRIITVMTNEFICRNWTIHDFPCDSMREKSFSTNLYFSISVPERTIPQPAFICLRHPRPKYDLKRERGVGVSRQKPIRDPLDVSPTPSCHWSKSRGLITTALTQTKGDLGFHGCLPLAPKGGHGRHVGNVLFGLQTLAVTTQEYRRPVEVSI